MEILDKIGVLKVNRVWCRCEKVFIAMGNRVPIFLMNRRHARTDADYALIFWTRIATDKRRVNKAN